MTTSNFSNTAKMREAGDGFRTFDDLQEALVEAVTIYRRAFVRGAWPFAGDGPWHLFRHEAGDHGAYDAARMPKVPPSRAELGEMQQRLDWLRLVSDDDDRVLVVRAIEALANGASRVPWSRLVQAKARWRTADALSYRYRKVLAVLVKRVNRLEQDRRSGVVGGEFQSTVIG
ncbi:hypothetical protein [Sphingomonas sp. R1]|uniref:hypothetical protein n=1 Tax=Sphingomonas sp. R1 TaxID=399176 RepID=UPI0022242CCE|nr:hypothetical protein [Sphingomonas sp. R1]UYY77781.1 hypothetical protein OIM94_01885 [Sphingomonas sp. R1]